MARPPGEKGGSKSAFVVRFLVTYNPPLFGPLFAGVLTLGTASGWDGRCCAEVRRLDIR